MELNHQGLITKILQELLMPSSIIGEIRQYAGSSEPAGWVLCDGRPLDRDTYSELFAVIGITYGAGDGVTTFNIPDMRNRMPIGAGDIYSINDSGGNKDAIVPYHRHSVDAITSGGPSTNSTGGMSSNASHSHSVSWQNYNRGTGGSVVVGWIDSSLSDGAGDSHGTNTDHTHSMQSHTHSVGAHNTNYTGDPVTNANMPPYRAVNFIIYAGV